MKKLFAIAGTILYYFLYPMILLIIIMGPLMEFDVLMDVYKYNAPRTALGIGTTCFIGFLLFLSFKYSRLEWLYRKFPVLIPFLQMCLVMLVGIEMALLCANLWADNQTFNKGIAITLSIISIVVARAYLSYWYYKYPISYKVHKL
ncbi:MAG: hypothetical protein ACI35P_01160 [Bacillus sp. (in: firmicutes)]